MRRRFIPRSVPWLLAGTLLLAACGDGVTSTSGASFPAGSEPATTSSSTVATTVTPDTEPTDTSAGPTTVPPTTVPPTTVPPTTVPPTTSEPTPTVPLLADLCAAYGPVEEVGIVTSNRLTEISGLAASRSRDGVVWAHNDSGDRARVYALAPDGDLLQTVTLRDVDAVDWEDMAAGPGPDAASSYLYVGDIGDNDRIRPEISVHRFVEPEAGVDRVDVDTLRLRYPDGPHDAETLLLDAERAELVILTKSLGGRSLVFRAPADAPDGEVIILTPAGSVTLGLLRFATAGDVGFSGDRIAIRTLTDVFMWVRPPGSSVVDALAGEACSAPAAAERQGESIAFLADDAYVTISEGQQVPVHRAELR